MAWRPFYSYFMLEPQGAHRCVVCMGTACCINGATILDRMTDTLGVGPGQTTGDGQVSVLTAHCVDACSIAPVVVVDGEARGKAERRVGLQQVKAL
jgi:bidirectional [NiFe] hydrogenase diaphorase subunit